MLQPFLTAERRIILAACAILAILAGGCGRDYGYQTAPVSGVVTVDGKPLEEGTVMFFPTEGKMASGFIGEGGKYSLSTYEPNDGAIVGECRISVQVITGAGEANEMKTPPPSPVPSRYGTPETSGLSCTVKAGETNDVPLELKGT